MKTKYHAYYPSGNSFYISGSFQLLDGGEHGLLPCIETSEEAVTILDPRCLILDSVGECTYSPRDHKDTRFTPDMAEWLRENPEWPDELVAFRQTAK